MDGKGNSFFHILDHVTNIFVYFQNPSLYLPLIEFEVQSLEKDDFWNTYTLLIQKEWRKDFAQHGSNSSPGVGIEHLTDERLNNYKESSTTMS